MDRNNPETWNEAQAKEFIWDNLPQVLRDKVPFGEREAFLSKLLVGMRDRIVSMTDDELMEEIKQAYRERDGSSDGRET